MSTLRQLANDFERLREVVASVSSSSSPPPDLTSEEVELLLRAVLEWEVTGETLEHLGISNLPSSSFSSAPSHQTSHHTSDKYPHQPSSADARHVASAADHCLPLLMAAKDIVKFVEKESQGRQQTTSTATTDSKTAATTTSNKNNKSMNAAGEQQGQRQLVASLVPSSPFCGRGTPSDRDSTSSSSVHHLGSFPHLVSLESVLKTTIRPMALHHESSKVAIAHVRHKQHVAVKQWRAAREAAEEQRKAALTAHITHVGQTSFIDMTSKAKPEAVLRAISGPPPSATTATTSSSTPMEAAGGWLDPSEGGGGSGLNADESEGTGATQKDENISNANNTGSGSAAASLLAPPSANKQHDYFVESSASIRLQSETLRAQLPPKMAELSAMVRNGAGATSVAALLRHTQEQKKSGTNIDNNTNSSANDGRNTFLLSSNTTLFNELPSSIPLIAKPTTVTAAARTAASTFSEFSAMTLIQQQKTLANEELKSLVVSEENRNIIAALTKPEPVLTLTAAAIRSLYAKPPVTFVSAGVSGAPLVSFTTIPQRENDAHKKSNEGSDHDPIVVVGGGSGNPTVDFTAVIDDPLSLAQLEEIATTVAALLIEGSQVIVGVHDKHGRSPRANLQQNVKEKEEKENGEKEKEGKRSSAERHHFFLSAVDALQAAIAEKVEAMRRLCVAPSPSAACTSSSNTTATVSPSSAPSASIVSTGRWRAAVAMHLSDLQFPMELDVLCRSGGHGSTAAAVARSTSADNKKVAEVRGTSSETLLEYLSLVCTDRVAASEGSSGQVLDAPTATTPVASPHKDEDRSFGGAGNSSNNSSSRDVAGNNARGFLGGSTSAFPSPRTTTSFLDAHGTTAAVLFVDLDSIVEEAALEAASSSSRPKSKQNNNNNNSNNKNDLISCPPRPRAVVSMTALSALTDITDAVVICGGPTNSSVFMQKRKKKEGKEGRGNDNNLKLSGDNTNTSDSNIGSSSRYIPHFVAASARSANAKALLKLHHRNRSCGEPVSDALSIPIIPHNDSIPSDPYTTSSTTFSSFGKTSEGASTSFNDVEGNTIDAACASAGVGSLRPTLAPHSIATYILGQHGTPAYAEEASFGGGFAALSNYKASLVEHQQLAECLSLASSHIREKLSKSIHHGGLLSSTAANGDDQDSAGCAAVVPPPPSSSFLILGDADGDLTLFTSSLQLNQRGGPEGCIYFPTMLEVLVGEVDARADEILQKLRSNEECAHGRNNEEDNEHGRKIDHNERQQQQQRQHEALVRYLLSAMLRGSFTNIFVAGKAAPLLKTMHENRLIQREFLTSTSSTSSSPSPSSLVVGSHQGQEEQEEETTTRKKYKSNKNNNNKKSEGFVVPQLPIPEDIPLSLVRCCSIFLDVFDLADVLNVTDIPDAEAEAKELAAMNMGMGRVVGITPAGRGAPEAMEGGADDQRVGEKKKKKRTHKNKKTTTSDMKKDGDDATVCSLDQAPSSASSSSTVGGLLAANLVSSFLGPSSATTAISNAFRGLRSGEVNINTHTPSVSERDQQCSSSSSSGGGGGGVDAEEKEEPKAKHGGSTRRIASGSASVSRGFTFISAESIRKSLEPYPFDQLTRSAAAAHHGGGGASFTEEGRRQCQGGSHHERGRKEAEEEGYSFSSLPPNATLRQILDLDSRTHELRFGSKRRATRGVGPYLVEEIEERERRHLLQQTIEAFLVDWLALQHHPTDMPFPSPSLLAAEKEGEQENENDTLSRFISEARKRAAHKQQDYCTTNKGNAAAGKRSTIKTTKRRGLTLLLPTDIIVTRLTQSGKSRSEIRPLLGLRGDDEDHDHDDGVSSVEVGNTLPSGLPPSTSLGAEGAKYFGTAVTSSSPPINSPRPDSHDSLGEADALDATRAGPSAVDDDDDHAVITTRVNSGKKAPSSLLSLNTKRPPLRPASSAEKRDKKTRTQNKNDAQEGGEDVVEGKPHENPHAVLANTSQNHPAFCVYWYPTEVENKSTLLEQRKLTRERRGEEEGGRRQHRLSNPSSYRYVDLGPQSIAGLLRWTVPYSTVGTEGSDTVNVKKESNKSASAGSSMEASSMATSSSTTATTVLALGNITLSTLHELTSDAIFPHMPFLGQSNPLVDVFTQLLLSNQTSSSSSSSSPSGSNTSATSLLTLLSSPSTSLNLLLSRVFPSLPPLYVSALKRCMTERGGSTTVDIVGQLLPSAVVATRAASCNSTQLQAANAHEPMMVVNPQLLQDEPRIVPFPLPLAPIASMKNIFGPSLGTWDSAVRSGKGGSDDEGILMRHPYDTATSNVSTAAATANNATTPTTRDDRRILSSPSSTTATTATYTMSSASAAREADDALVEHLARLLCMRMNSTHYCLWAWGGCNTNTHSTTSENRFSSCNGTTKASVYGGQWLLTERRMMAGLFGGSEAKSAKLAALHFSSPHGGSVHTQALGVGGSRNVSVGCEPPEVWAARIVDTLLQYTVEVKTSASRDNNESSATIATRTSSTSTDQRQRTSPEGRTGQKQQSTDSFCSVHVAFPSLFKRALLAIL